MFHIVLFQPEIPPNTGAIIRLCANTGFRLHLIEPLGFDLDDAKLRRAGLDYHELQTMQTWPDLNAFLQAIKPPHIFAISTKGAHWYTEAVFQHGDALLFGRETEGLPDEVLGSIVEGHVLRLPMQSESRSLNLANAVSVVAYEAWRQNHFEGAD